MLEIHVAHKKAFTVQVYLCVFWVPASLDSPTKCQ
jgi:hypothetical protein